MTTPAFMLPLTLPCGVTIPNRIALAPMTTSLSEDDGALGPDEHAWLERRAQGGFGIVMTCAAHVSRHGRGWVRQLGAFDDSLLPGLEQLASAVAAHESVGLLQLHHGGMRSFAELNEGRQPVSASEFELEIPRFERPRAATDAEIEGIIDDFAAAARRAVDAGFHGVEIHAGNGYFITQFLSPRSNGRSDRWGGSLENRARVLREVVERTRRAMGPRAVLGVRLSPEYARWLELDLDDSLQMACWVAESGADFIDLSMDAAYDGPFDRLPFHKPGDVPVVTRFREALPGPVAVMVAGGIWTPEDAERAMDLGADIAALGRAAILNPDWPQRAAQPGYEPRRPPLAWDEYRQLDVGDGFRHILERMKYVSAP